jgi:single-strand selective monofunctional uracil DNA glycosylase
MLLSDCQSVSLNRATNDLIADLGALSFGPPVSHVYNPLVYARAGWDLYQQRFAAAPKEVVLLGMNPGPWGMAQTGVPFGEINAVRDFLGIEAAVSQPANMHPKRPVDGFACRRREVSGRRVWGWVQKTFGPPERFFSRFFIANYCPLLFIDADGRNRTPNQLPAAERRPLEEVCDRALRRTVACLAPRLVVGIGAFAAQRAAAALAGMDVRVGRMTHPSPANPRANRDWEAVITAELSTAGVVL